MLEKETGVAARAERSEGDLIIEISFKDIVIWGDENAVQKEENNIDNVNKNMRKCGLRAAYY